MWTCPTCKITNEGNFCSNCGTKKIQQTSSSATSAQIAKLAKSVKTMKIICIILAIAIVVLSVAFVFAYNGTWNNINALWKNADRTQKSIQNNVNWLKEGFDSLQSQIYGIWDYMWYIHFD